MKLNQILIILLLITLSGCGVINKPKTLFLKGSVVNASSGQMVNKLSFTVFRIDEPKASNFMISDKTAVVHSSTSESGIFDVKFEASWKFQIEADEGVFCHSLNSETRYFDVSSFLKGNMPDFLKLEYCN